MINTMERKTKRATKSPTPPNEGVLSGLSLKNERARELQSLQEVIYHNGKQRDGSMNVIRTSAVKLDVVGEYARFRERMDLEMLSFDFGEPPEEALECGISNTFLPLNPDVEDIKQWRQDNNELF